MKLMNLMSVSCLVMLTSLLYGQETRTAVIPGWNRFRESGLTAADGGRLLISELNCQSCHGEFPGSSIAPRQAPILTFCGDRISAEYLRSYLAAPSAAHPGTSMPSFHALSQGDLSTETIEALVSFLTLNGKHLKGPAGAAAARRGDRLYHTSGCVACHGSMTDSRTSSADELPFLRPLGTLTAKYSVSSLTAFLINPHAVRPSGRMPSLNLKPEEARDVASFLMKDVQIEASINYEYYEGSWEALPDFDQLTAESRGGASDFSVEWAGRTENFALRFTGFLHLPQGGEYDFWLRSDDGSRLKIDNQIILDHDGIHPATEIHTRKQLTSGPHPLVLEYFERNGEESLSLEIAGGGIERQPAAALMSQTQEPPKSSQDAQPRSGELADRGRQLFASLRCAACHQHGEGERRVTAVGDPVPSFAAMNVNDGCLNAVKSSSDPNIPQFPLSEQQCSDLRAAIVEARTASGPTDDRTHLSHIMMTMNCYACHQRTGTGGVPEPLNSLFSGTIPEMGDEGRLPPNLDGAGDKLNADWLRHLLDEGAQDRPYMNTRMPKFGLRNLGPLADLMVKSDQRSEVQPVTINEAPHRVTAAARLMVGDQALSCIKCHDFDRYHATGIRAMDMTTMTRRLRRDWFHRYLLNPQAYRPGTRMPSAWPNGKSVVPKILDGLAATQIEAIWQYLADGRQAKVPSGLQRQSIELKPVGRARIYRNFVEGLSARGIAVGYPEGAHLGWDAEHMTVRLIWHGAFIDASKHWEGRGPGNQIPLGDHVMTLPAGPPLARLSDPLAPWPVLRERDGAFRFLGYQLNSRQQPVFLYQWNDVRVSDDLQPVAGQPDTAFQRTVEFRPGAGDQTDAWFRTAASSAITAIPGGWKTHEGLRLTFQAGEPVVRKRGETEELLIAIPLRNGAVSRIQYTMDW